MHSEIPLPATENSGPENPLYERVAARLTEMIEVGTFQPGDRVPSVRRLSQEFGVSVSTAVQAYRRLENSGVLEARPQSGFFVRGRLISHHAEPDLSSPPGKPTEVSIEELAMRVMRDGRNPHLVQLGAALPHPSLLPGEKLDRCLSAAARRVRARGPMYDVPPGCEALRVQIAQRMLDAGCSLAPEEIITTNGCLEAMVLALRATCAPGDTVAVESPAYYGVLQAIRFLGLRVLEIPTHPRTGLSVEALRFALEHHPIRACLMTPTFSNPLGSRMPEEAKRELVQLLADAEVPLIEDDLYSNLQHADGSRPRAAKAYDSKGLVLLCSSFSKDLAPSYRVGWIVPGRFRTTVERFKSALNVASATIPQLAVADFLANGGYDHHLRRIRRTYGAQVLQVSQAVIDAFPEGTRVTRPTGGYVIWVELPERVNSLELYDQALTHGITIAPGPLFSATGGYRNFVRLCCASWSPEVEKAIRTLGGLVRSAL